MPRRGATQVFEAGYRRLVDRLIDPGLLREITGVARNRRFRFQPCVRLLEEPRKGRRWTRRAPILEASAPDGKIPAPFTLHTWCAGSITPPADLRQALRVAAEAGMKTAGIAYRDGDTELEGHLAWDDSTAARRPGILVVHDWMGISPETERRCAMLAELGYVAFAADVYGKGVRPSSREEAAGLAGSYKGDRALYRRRLQAALDELKRSPLVDPARCAAIGYCFGGTGALELARAGADLEGIVSFHGGLDSLHPEDAESITAKVLVLHGADDPTMSAEQVTAFQDELRKAGVDWQMVYYGGAVHSFTNPGAGDDPGRGAAYDERADHRSWHAMRNFFDEIFA